MKNKGVLCQEQTQDLLRIAAPYIYNKLPFSTRQLDVLEELANGNDTNTIAKNLGIVPSTVETYRRDIRNIVKDKISTELNDIRFARHLRELMIL